LPPHPRRPRARRRLSISNADADGPSDANRRARQHAMARRSPFPRHGIGTKASQGILSRLAGRLLQRNRGDRREHPTTLGAGDRVSFQALGGVDRRRPYDRTYIVPDERRLPFRVQWFADGFGVIGAASGHKDLAGARLVAVGDFTVDAAFDSVTQYDGSDNMWGARLWAERHLTSATALAAMHLVREGAPVRVTFIGDSGRREMSFPWPSASVAPAARIDPRSTAPAARLLPFGWRYDTTARAVIVHYDVCEHMLEFRAMADTVLRFVDSAKVTKIVVDVRGNPGGNNEIARPFIHGLASRSKTLPRGSIYVLMGRSTFSSAK